MSSTDLFGGLRGTTLEGRTTSFGLVAIVVLVVLLVAQDLLRARAGDQIPRLVALTAGAIPVAIVAGAVVVARFVQLA